MQVQTGYSIRPPYLPLKGRYLLLPFCDRALPAADLLALLVRPSRKTLEAAFAALELVCLVFLAMLFSLLRC